MRFNVGLFSIEFRRDRRVKRPRRGRRQAKLSEQDKFDRAVEASYWMIDRYFRGMNFSRRNRKRSLTAEAWTHGYQLMQSAEVMVGDDFIVESLSAATMRLTRKADWYRVQMDKPGFLLPW